MGVSSVYQLDLNKKTDEYATPQLVLRDPRMVRLVEVDPFSRSVLKEIPLMAFILNFTGFVGANSQPTDLGV